MSCHLSWKVLDHAKCEVCSGADETTAHIMFGCPFATSFWAALHITMPREMAMTQLCDLRPPSHVPPQYYSTFLLLCCWQLWKRRNNVIFRSQQDTLQTVLRSTREDSRLWGCRLPIDHRHISMSWCSLFESAM